jgi:hypothetical protein
LLIAAPRLELDVAWSFGHIADAGAVEAEVLLVRRRRELPGHVDVKGVDVVVDGAADDPGVEEILAAARALAADPEQLFDRPAAVDPVDAGADITAGDLRMIGDVELSGDQRRALGEVEGREKVDLTA